MIENITPLTFNCPLTFHQVNGHSINGGPIQTEIERLLSLALARY